MTIRITILDTESGESETKDITDDVLVITAGRHYVDGVQKFSNGTQIYTIKADKSAAPS